MTVTASNYELKANDLYETEAWATEALLRRFPMKGEAIWEPAAGNHAIADVVKKCGLAVLTSDIATYDRKHDFVGDFLSLHFHLDMESAIITNPPYGRGNRLAVQFCERALQHCSGTIAMLLTAKFDFGKTRHHLFRDNPRFTAKINLVDRISWEGNGQTGTEDHAWYVWTSKRDTDAPCIYYEGKQ